jgi:GNAT superfamily N-acetyltransferase
LLSKTYWAANRPREVIAESIRNSVCYGVYCGEEQIGFGRVVTDHATVYYICDVIVDEKYRDKGLGKRLVQCITDDFYNKLGILATKDAHELYQQFGFTRDEKSFMRRLPVR